MHPFQNPDNTLEDRLNDLSSQLTLDEKSRLLLHDATGIERLGILPYPWWSECLHGVARNGRATVFPQAIAMAAVFDPNLMTRIGDAISDEARAIYAISVQRSVFTRYAGLTFWTPNINIFRDPRWGRGQETYGEDPWLTSRLGVSFVKALQGNDPQHLKIAACAKHFAAHSGPEALRHEFDAKVNARDFRDTYLPAFEALVKEADVEIVMGAYNRTNGHPCCAHPQLMSEILRGEWGFKGHYVSDCWAIRDFHENHKVTNSPAESAALAVKEGCDVNCGCTYEHIGDAVKEGLISEAEVDLCFKRAMATRFRLGEFDPPQHVRWKKIPPSVIRCSEHIELAREAATKSMVLMKNNGLLPLNRDKLRTVFVTGPHATNLDVLLGNYFGSSTRLVSFLEGITEACPTGINVEYKIGCGATYPNKNPADWVSSVGAAADVCIACLGISPLHEGEEGDAIESADLGDRPNLSLPPHQIDLIRNIRERGDAKIVVVLTGGSPITDAEIFDLADAVVWAWYPGEQGGNALADILFGDVNPSGRLPITFPKSLDDIPPYEDYSMSGRTYRYMEAEPLFPFGFGLSYTTFKYHSIQVSENRASAVIEVENIGGRSGEEVVQIYSRAVVPTVTAPKQSLIGFQRISLEAGQRIPVEIALNPKAFSLIDEDGNRVSHEGEWEVIASGACPIPRAETLGASQPVHCRI